MRRTRPKDHREQVWQTARKRQRAGASGWRCGRGIEVLPRRWVVERTFAWFGKSRRLSKDDEFLPESSEAMIYLAMTT